jgi:hypothetical protein
MAYADILRSVTADMLDVADLLDDVAGRFSGWTSWTPAGYSDSGTYTITDGEAYYYRLGSSLGLALWYTRLSGTTSGSTAAIGYPLPFNLLGGNTAGHAQGTVSNGSITGSSEPGVFYMVEISSAPMMLARRSDLSDFTAGTTRHIYSVGIGRIA